MSKDTVRFTREEFTKLMGEEGLILIQEAMKVLLTSERRLELMNNPIVDIVYKDYINIVLGEDKTLHVSIEAHWGIRMGGRIKAVIKTIELFDNQEELDKSKAEAKAGSIKLNQN